MSGRKGVGGVKTVFNSSINNEQCFNYFNFCVIGNVFLADFVFGSDPLYIS